MTCIHARSTALATAHASASLANPFLNIRRWLTALLIAVAMLATGSHVASADLEIVLPYQRNTEAPFEVGIIAAQSGRLRDAITILTPHANSGHVKAYCILCLIYLRDRVRR